MRAKIVAVVIISGFVAISAHRGLLAEQAQSIWDGVYTQEQAQRGDSLYTAQCASCHAPDMSGGEMAPGLTGGDFRSDWDGLSVGDLFERVRVSMPQNNPGSLSRQQIADILAFVFSKGGFPVGKTELSSKLEMLSQIKFVASKP